MKKIKLEFKNGSFPFYKRYSKEGVMLKLISPLNKKGEKGSMIVDVVSGKVEITKSGQRVEGELSSFGEEALMLQKFLGELVENRKIAGVLSFLTGQRSEGGIPPHYKVLRKDTRIKYLSEVKASYKASAEHSKTMTFSKELPLSCVNHSVIKELFDSGAVYKAQKKLGLKKTDSLSDFVTDCGELSIIDEIEADRIKKELIEIYSETIMDEGSSRSLGIFSQIKSGGAKVSRFMIELLRGYRELPREINQKLKMPDIVGCPRNLIPTKIRNLQATPNMVTNNPFVSMPGGFIEYVGIDVDIILEMEDSEAENIISNSFLAKYGRNGVVVASYF